MTVGRLNSSVVNAEYAVRGELAIRAEELRKELAKNTKSSHAFGKIINCNIGNPQQLAQKPITFFRQVSALIEYPALLDPSNLQVTTQIFPPDAIERAKRILADVGGSVGAYSHSQGIPAVRANVAKFIEERDGYPSRPEDIFLTAGASPGVQLILQSLISHPDVGIMIPIPQYPLYTASIALFNGKPVPYYLDESSTWGLSASELRRSITQAREAGVDVRALCVINPGNPTGSCLSIDNMRDILSFCAEENLMLLADEVYQANIYEPQQAPFHSFKKVLKSMGPECEHLELISFHSISKGMIGECGRRGGYFECHGIDPAVKEMFYKVASISLCPPVSGQVMVDLMVNPPRVGDPSYKVYKAEMDGIYESLKRRAKLLAEGLNKLAGVSCQPAQGAMYLFPTVTIPQKAIDHAKKLGKEPDAVYCMELLNATGVCVVPGSGFGQKNGTYHFRTTFLPPEDEMGSFISLISDFHDKWMGKWR
ncbi:pyridoxal phosphate-dependent transferase [Gaertneriomyces semiglobifer]|nr:pyridoxal phosphate-dependent transferase [Gaertneriomyces semiglobifer]